MRRQSCQKPVRTFAILVCAVILGFWAYATLSANSADRIQAQHFLTVLSSLQREVEYNIEFEVQSPPDTVPKGILISYMRGGTTFVGSVFDKHAQVFYLFEPEWLLALHTLPEYKPLKFVDGRVQEPVWKEHDDVLRDLIRNYMYCNISGVDKDSLLERFMRNSEDTEKFYHCVRQPKVRSFQSCVQEIEWLCKSKEFRFLKTIRLRMDVAVELLKNDPSLRIVHMIRDPRGVAMSRIGWGEYYAASPIITFGEMCGHMLRDINTVENLPRDLSRRVLTVLYEDLAERPEEMIEEIFSFLHLSVPRNVRSFLRGITKGGMDKREGFSTQRANSSKTAHRWRSTIDWALCQEIDNLCSRVYKKAGYFPARNLQSVRNYSIPMRVPFSKNTYLQNSRKYGDRDT